MTTRTLEIARGQLREYKGNYSYYLEQKEEDKRLFEKRAKQQQTLRKQTEDFIERFRYKASKATQVQSRIKMLEREELLAAESEGGSVHFAFPECPRSGHEVLTLQDVDKSYGSKKVFEKLSFSVSRGERVALVGVNGAGKSTLCRLLSRKEEPSSGSISFGHKVLCGFFSQESIDNLHYENTVWQEVLAEGEYFSPQYKRNLLGAFLFSGEDIDKPISVLSGGEKTRLALLKMLLRETNLLILDEPTNHLDMETKELFQKALLAYSGTLVIVSHDRHFLDTLVERVIELHRGKGREYLGNYSYFIEKREALLQEQKQNEEAQERGSEEKPEEAFSASGYKSKEQKRREAEMRQVLSERRRTVTAHLAPLEKEIEDLESRKAALEEALCSPEVLENTEKRTAHLKEHGEIEQLLPEKMQEWEELMEKLSVIEEEFALS
jgi:ATP-binding cassette subfamily F protein 3